MRPSGNTTSCWWAWSSSTARRRDEGPGRRGLTGKQPNRCRNQPCRPAISSIETMKRQSRPVRRRPAAWGSSRASQRERWVGASSTGPSRGRCPAPSTVSSRKNRGRARSWVSTIARGPRMGLIGTSELEPRSLSLASGVIGGLNCAVMRPGNGFKGPGKRVPRDDHNVGVRVGPPRPTGAVTPASAAAWQWSGLAQRVGG